LAKYSLAEIRRS